MRQIPFGWRKKTEDDEALDAVVLEPKTTDAVIALMANALIAVVRGVDHAAEPTDER